MPQTEDEAQDSRTSDSPTKVATLWQKFHFSGRVIMCSVLFGLGLILIGGLIFAINLDDDTSENLKKDENVDAMPTKAPSNYVGPVVMGIGGFIVTVGVIMCLFETQVCRKKTGDSKPLIPDKNEDVEVKVSDSSPIPSTSQYHKNHKHKSRKASASPRKTKAKHTKSHSHEEKKSSSKSPPISIDKSKNFMTSSEENFLTPPNTLSEHAALRHSNSREVEIQTSSSLMKSFTSSGTWNQSTEFLTPTASYKENPVSVDNSVELNEKQDQVNFKTNEASPIDYTRPEYMTPLTSEEERIKEMLTQVKNEQIKIGLDQSEDKEAKVDLSSEHGNDTILISVESGVSKNEDIKIAMDDHPIDASSDNSVVEGVTEKYAKELPDRSENIDSNNIIEENALLDNISSVSNISAAGFAENRNEAEFKVPDIIDHTHTDEKKDDNTKSIPFSEDSKNEKLESFLHPEISASHLTETINVPEFQSDPSNETNSENNLELDLESSASSEETLVSRDSSIEKPKFNDAETPISLVEEISSDTSKNTDASESPKVDQCSSNQSINGHQDSLTDISKVEKVGANDLIIKEKDSDETKNIDEKSTEKFS